MQVYSKLLGLIPSHQRLKTGLLVLPRFSIQKLLIYVAFSGGLLAILTQVGVERAEFQISENELTLNDNELVSGELWGYMGKQVPSADQWSFVCEIRNVDRTALLSLKAGQKHRIRFRENPIWPLKKQDPFRIYISRSLGIESDQIVGYITTDQGTKVVIDGSHVKMDQHPVINTSD